MNKEQIVNYGERNYVVGMVAGLFTCSLGNIFSNGLTSESIHLLVISFTASVILGGFCIIKKSREDRE